MDPKKLFFDERFRGVCVYCGATGNTRDHVPSKVLLDEPYPADLAVVSACGACNNAFSKDEPYLACLIECAIHGSTTPDDVERGKVKRLLGEKPHLVAQIDRSRETSPTGNLVWIPDATRVSAIILKLSRGHVAYEFAEPRLEFPSSVMIKPLCLLEDYERREFEDGISHAQLWPEIGSRAFCRLFVANREPFVDSGWTIVQPGRYRYLALQGPTMVRIVLSEYLACEVIWD